MFFFCECLKRTALCCYDLFSRDTLEFPETHLLLELIVDMVMPFADADGFSFALVLCTYINYQTKYFILPYNISEN